MVTTGTITSEVSRCCPSTARFLRSSPVLSPMKFWARRIASARVDWTWAKERYQELWVNEQLRVQRGKHLLFEVKSGKPFIEDWAFATEGVVVKSRATHGLAWIELFSLSTGKQIQLIKKAYTDDLPLWAKPFAD